MNQFLYLMALLSFVKLVMQSTKDKVKLKVMEALGLSLVLLKIKTKPNILHI